MQDGIATFTDPVTGVSITVMTTGRAAAHLKVHPNTIIYHAKKGHLPYQQLGRNWLFQQSDLDAFEPRKAGRPRKENKDG